MGMDWAQLVSLIPALGAIRQGGPEFNAFMQAYQAADDQAFGQDQQRQSMDMQQERWASQDARQAQQDTFRRDEALNNRTQGNIGELIAAMPGMADNVVSAPTMQEAIPSPAGKWGAYAPTMEGASPEQAVQGDVNSLAELFGSPELGPKMAPFVGPTVSRAQKAQANRRRKALKDAVELAEERQTPETLQQAGAYITVPLDDGSVEKIPYQAALDELQMPAVTLKPKAEDRPESRSLDVQAADALARGDDESYQRLMRVRRDMSGAGRNPKAADLIPVTPGIGAATGEAALADLTPGEQGVVRRLVDYKQLLPSGMALRTPYWQKMLERAGLYDPSFDQTQYNARQKVRTDFTSGKAASNVRSLNTAVGHLASLDAKAKALGNAGPRVWNWIKNSSLTELGDERVKAFLTTANAVAGELATVFKGTAGTDQEIKAWRELINESDSPEQLRAVVDQAVELLSSRLDALTQQYITGMGKPKDFTILTPKSRKIIAELGLDVDAHDPITGASMPMVQPSTGGGQKIGRFEIIGVR